MKNLFIKKTQKFKTSIFKENSFSNKFAFTLSGNVINLLLQIALSPILSRIYSPEAYGIYAVFNALSMNFAMLSSLSYTNAILKAKSEKTAIQLVIISISLSAIFSLLGIVLIVVLQNFSISFGLNNLGWLVLIIPLSSFIYNANISLSSLNIFSHKVSKDVTIVTSTNIFNRVFNLGYGIISNGATTGLILGDIFSKAIRGLLLIYVQFNSFRKRFSTKELITTFRKYKNFPLYILPSSLVGILSSQLPIYLFSFYFGSSIVGYYSFASAMLLIPIQLFGNSTSSIFLKKATDTYLDDGLTGLQLITNKIFWYLLLIGFVSYAIIMPFGEYSFKIVFGKEWAMAGVFFGYLAFSYIIMLASQPLNNIFLVVQKENTVLWINLVGILIRLLSLMPGIYYGDFILAIKLFSLLNFCYYLAISIIVFRILEINLSTFLIKIILLLSAVCLYLFLVKTYLPNYCSI